MSNSNITYVVYAVDGNCSLSIYLSSYQFAVIELWGAISCSNRHSFL